ncbi:MAG: MBL fold metallo-hydrolase [Candidatus Fimivivens sp.]
MKLLHTTLGPIQTNCYFAIAQNGETAIIDPGAHPARVNQIIEENNLTPQYILLTHGHFDHIGAAKGIVAKHPHVKIVIGEKDAPMLPAAIENSNWRQYISDENYLDLKADILTREGDTFTVGELTFRVIETPGHTRGGVCYICEDAIFTGDTLFKHECGRTDLEGGDYQTILRSLKRLHDLPGDYNVLPGHEALSTLAEERSHNPYMREALK